MPFQQCSGYMLFIESVAVFQALRSALPSLLFSFSRGVSVWLLAAKRVVSHCRPPIRTMGCEPDRPKFCPSTVIDAPPVRRAKRGYTLVTLIVLRRLPSQ